MKTVQTARIFSKPSRSVHSRLGDPAITNSADLLESAGKVIEEFVCYLYSVKAVKTVNEARVVIFDRKYRPKNENEKFKKSSANLKASTFLPCNRELEQHTRRSIYKNI